MEAAEVKSPSMQSTSVSRAKSFGTAALALRPRFPSAAAVQARTESSGISRSDTISVMVLSSTEIGLTRCVKSARLSAASARPMGDCSARTFAIASSSLALSTRSVDPCTTLTIRNNSTKTVEYRSPHSHLGIQGPSLSFMVPSMFCRPAPGAPSFAGFCEGWVAGGSHYGTCLSRRPRLKRNLSPSFIHAHPPGLAEKIEVVTAPAPILRLRH